MLSTIAAFVAAAAAIVNVLLTARFARRSALDAWRRDRIHPLVVAVQTASYSHETRARTLLAVKDRGPGRPPPHLAYNDLVRELHDDAESAYREMTVALAELELVAPEQLVLAAQNLRVQHMGFMIAEDFPDQMPDHEGISTAVSAARTRFVSAARRELGTADRRPRSWRSRLRVPGWVARLRPHKPEQ